MNIAVTNLIPHQGAMCLLDSIDTWDERTIMCHATSHWRPDHPLKGGSGLRALCAIEYGAQAAAAHACLLAGPDPPSHPPRFLASVRDVVMSGLRLDALDDPLTILAELILSQRGGHIYDITVAAGPNSILTGRITVMASNPATVDVSQSVRGAVRP
jgi:predicted hotdog family 3-hydroxylacyl-ACP dehydratase